VRSKLVTPHAAVLIWNYIDRDDSSGAANNTHAVEQVIVGTSSIISISTSKAKSAPAGQFEVRLAPRFNWVTRITPGSWCCILMSQDKLPTMSNKSVGNASEASFKMLGRIDSVRGVVDVDQVTGARRTSFIISGRDWGSVFESLLYIDPIMANNQFKANPISQAYSILGLNMYQSFSETKALPSSADLVSNMVKLWGGGATGTAALDAKNKFGDKPIMSKPFITTNTQFRLPKEVAVYMSKGAGLSLGGVSLGDASSGPPVPGETAYNFADLITLYHGKLKKSDTGKDDPYEKLTESFGIPNPHNFFGQHTFWQLLTELSNTALNELVTDIRWENGAPKFALYHRIRPFVNNPLFLEKIQTTSFFTEPDSTQAKSIVDNNMSLFKNVKKVSIDIEDVLNINFGTNWRDKINFIEVTPTSNLLPESQAIDAKQHGQTYDPKGYERDGFKPLMVQSSFLPYADGATPIIKDLTYWKFLIREWHFNTHMLLNGAITMVGQNKYIQVGDNIIIPSKILGSAPLNQGQTTPIPVETFLLAHVENISHNFSVNQETGARSFMTTVQFVRGVITDKTGIPVNLLNPLIAEGNAIDKDASIISPQEERNKNIFGTSVDSDPDTQKLGKDGLV
jgi:hypothetical protein